MTKNRKWLRKSFFWLLVLLILISVIVFVFRSRTSVPTVTISTVLSDIKTDIAHKKQDDLTITGNTLILTRNKTGNILQESAAISDPIEITQILNANGIDYVNNRFLTLCYEPPSLIWGFLGNIGSAFPFFLFALLLLFILHQTQSSHHQTMSFSKSRARRFIGKKQSMTFADIAGVENIKQDLQEIVEFLKYPAKFAAFGARTPKGLLLVGPPGTGKMLISRAIAGEADVPFFSISGSEFVEMFVGVGASHVRDLFDQAKRNSPCIVFVDEIDAVGRQRGAGLGGSQDECEQTLNQILVEMDGFDAHTNVIVIAATNRPDILDPALLRPGRFDRQIVLDRPDLRGRIAILQVHTRRKPLEQGVSLDVIAKQTPGFSGADLSNLLNEAAILAARRNKKSIGMSELEEAIGRVVAGPARKSRIISTREKTITAYHEVGHALVARILPNTDPVHKISIVAHGQAGGFTMLLPTENRYLWSKSQFADMLAYALGGHVAELIIFGEVTTGASNDIENVTKIARSMVTEYGMSDRIGPMTLDHKAEFIIPGHDFGEKRNYSEQTSREVDEEVRAIIQTAFKKAHDILLQNKTRLIIISEHLIKEETLEGPVFESLFHQQPPDDQYEGPSVLAGMPDTNANGSRGQPQLSMPDTYQIPPQLQPPHSNKTSA
jgi:cell division protease FtsH